MRAKFARMWNKQQYRWKYMMDREGILKEKYSVRRSSSNLKWYWDDYFTDLRTPKKAHKE